MIKNISKTKFHEEISNYIRYKIINGELKNGDRIIETSVAKELGVSQSPVREALRDLEVMGLVKLVPYKGCYVLPIDKNRLLQVYEIRSMLECFAAEKGIKNISDEAIDRMEKDLVVMDKATQDDNSRKMVEYDVPFHLEIVKAADNFMLEKMWNLVGAFHWSFVTITAHHDMGYFLESHKNILQLVKNRDTSGTIKELKDHFNTAASFVIKGIFE